MNLKQFNFFYSTLFLRVRLVLWWEKDSLFGGKKTAGRVTHGPQKKKKDKREREKEREEARYFNDKSARERKMSLSRASNCFEKKRARQSFLSTQREKTIILLLLLLCIRRWGRSETKTEREREREEKVRSSSSSSSSWVVPRRGRREKCSLGCD